MSAPARVHEARGLDSLQTQFFFRDDFIGKQLQDIWDEDGSAGGSSAVVDGETGGVVRLTTDGDDNDFWYIHWGNILSLSLANHIAVEIKAKAGDPDNAYYYLYLIEGATGNNWITLRTDGTANWKLVSRKAGSTSSTLDTGIAVTTDYVILRIELHTHGSDHAHFYIDNVETANSPHSTDIPASYLEPRLQVYNYEAQVNTFDIDYITVKQDR
jgi:hypothetical protein